MATMLAENREQMLRAYAAGDMTWHELQTRGFDDYIEVLGGLGELGLRPPVARMVGPNIVARERGRARVAELLRANIGR